jgi:hypothetical protein
MATTVSPATSTRATRADAVPLTGKAILPVKFFFGLGLVILAVFTNTIVQWILSDDFKPAPVGTDEIPKLTLILVRNTEAFFAIVSVYFLWRLLFKPWIRDKRISWDGMIMLALLTMWVQDPMCNYFNFTFSYNAYFINMGSWTMHLPGWQSPRQGNLPEPIFMMGGVYLWWTTLNVIAFSWALRRMRVWLPQLSTMGHIPIAFFVVCVLDWILEIPCVWLGIFAYPGAPAWATWWAGEPHQFPIYETVFMNFNYMSIGLLRFYRDDKGESWAERGISEFKFSERTKSFMRWVALVGYCNLSYFIVYFMPYNWMAMQADTFPAYPSYMRYEICGQGTPYACPSREVPIPSRHSLAIPPDDPRLSDEARRN